MKKALSQEEARVSPRWGTGVELRSAGGPWSGPGGSGGLWSAQQRRTNSEVFGPTVKEEAVQGVASNGTSSGMVIVTPSGTPKARISMSSMDRGREDYINQFSERVGQKNFFYISFSLLHLRHDRYRRRRQSKPNWRASTTTDKCPSHRLWLRTKLLMLQKQMEMDPTGRRLCSRQKRRSRPRRLR